MWSFLSYNCPTTALNPSVWYLSGLVPHYCSLNIQVGSCFWTVLELVYFCPLGTLVDIFDCCNWKTELKITGRLRIQNSSPPPLCGGCPVNELLFPMEGSVHPATPFTPGTLGSSLTFPRSLFLIKQHSAATCPPTHTGEQAESPSPLAAVCCLFSKAPVNSV